MAVNRSGIGAQLSANADNLKMAKDRPVNQAMIGLSLICSRFDSQSWHGWWQQQGLRTVAAQEVICQRSRGIPLCQQVTFQP